MAIGIGEASLIALIVESILYGFYTVLTAAAWNILIARRRNGEPLKKAIFSVSVAMYLLATVHIAVDIRRIIVGIFELSSDPSEIDAYFHSFSETSSVFKNAVYVAQTILGDSFMIYRTYVVWGGMKLVIAPMLILLLANSVCGIGILVSFATATQGSSGFYTLDIGRWSLSFFSVTMIINVICTSLIAGRIYWSERQVSKLSIMRTSSLSPVGVIVIESGAIYSVSLACLLATYVTGSYGLTIVQAAVTTLIGLVYSLIIVRIGLGISPNITDHRYMSQYSSHSGASSRRRTGNIRPIAVEMTCSQIVQEDGTSGKMPQTDIGSSSVSRVDIDLKGGLEHDLSGHPYAN